MPLPPPPPMLAHQPSLLLASLALLLLPLQQLVSQLMLASPLMHFVNGTQIEIDGGQEKSLMDRLRDR